MHHLMAVTVALSEKAHTGPHLGLTERVETAWITTPGATSATSERRQFLTRQPNAALEEF